MEFPVARARSRFPSLAVKSGRQARIYFDNPGGTQVPKDVTARMMRYLTRSVANVGAAFRTSVETGALEAEARAAMAQFFNARSPSEVIFGASMTTLTLHVTHALERLVSPGDEIIVTKMDHDGNITPWLLMAQRCGLTLKWLDFSTETYRYDLADLERLLTPRTRIIAVNHASNLLGTINDIAGLSKRAKTVGALVYVDSVQYAPHGVVDVQKLGCDFLICSAYKFFGPHLGILWGREELLQSLSPLKLRASTNEVPNRYETGTLPFEQLAALLGALEYYAWVGDLVSPSGKTKSRSLRTRINRGKLAMQRHEEALSLQLVTGLKELPGARVRGITGKSEMHDRVSTVAFTLEGIPSARIAQALAKREIFVWSGSNYAIDLVERLGLTKSGGVVRVGAVHYNTAAEVRRFLDAMREIAREERA